MHGVPRKTVRIYGLANGVEKAPVADGIEVWCINSPRSMRIQRFAALREWTRWFNLHTLHHIRLRDARGYAYLQRKDGRRPVYLQEVDPTIPGSIPFPVEAVLAFAGHRFFTCTGVWLIALAMIEGFTRIEIYGYRLEPTGEHAYQRPGFLYWVQRARAAGIEVVIPKGCIGHPKGDGTETAPGNPLTYTGPLYGYEPHNAWYAETFG